jgi:predicted ArsR family transcriptional regulator
MTMRGSEQPIDWEALAPHIADPTREAIVEAIRWVGPLSAADLGNVLGEAEPCLACLHYHLTVLAEREVVSRIGRRQARGSFESLYVLFLP